MAKTGADQNYSHRTIEEYLDFERQAEERHEYLDGEIRTMAGESVEHSAICFNLATIVGAQLRGKKCRGFSPNMKVRSGHPIKQSRTPKGLFSYPDMMIVCGEPKFHDEHADLIIYPSVIFEVLSASTESFDRGGKFWRYRSQIETLTDYVLISQTMPLVEPFHRQANDEWILTSINGASSVFSLTSIKCDLPLSEIYENVIFPESAETKTKKAKKQKTKK